MVDKEKVISTAKKASFLSSALPYVAVVGVGYFAYKAIDQAGENFGQGLSGGIAGGVHEIRETITESVTETTNNIKSSTDTIYEGFNDLNDEANNNPILKFIAPDIQNEPTKQQQTALSNYKKGNVTQTIVCLLPLKIVLIINYSVVIYSRE